MSALMPIERLLLSGCGDNCVRILPPLTLSHSEADEIARRVEAACAAVARARAA